MIDGSPVTITIANDDIDEDPPPVDPDPVVSRPRFEAESLDVRERSSVSVTLLVEPAPSLPLRVALTTPHPSLLRVPAVITVADDGKATFTVEGRAAGKALIIATLADVPGQPEAALWVNVLPYVAPKQRSVRR